MIKNNTLFGMNIIEVSARFEPILKLSDDCPCTDKMRAEFNAWLVEMFGMRDASPVPNGMAYVFGNSILMRPESVALISNMIA